MKITIYGAGYVGLVTAVCFAEFGNQVLCMDIDQARIQKLKKGICPIHEPYLADMMKESLLSGNLQFTHHITDAVAHGFYQFIAVGTPQDQDGSADLQYVLAVAESIGQHVSDARLIITKSTVPIGTSEKVRQVIHEALRKRRLSVQIDIASNPEFLREGNAVEDFIQSDRIIIGTDNAQATAALKQLYMPFDRNQNRLINMDIVSAELTKYAANAMLATKISFINEISNIAERVGADIDNIRKGIGSDPRIGYAFIQPGCGYGGSCFPKDIRALEMIAKNHHYTPSLIAAVNTVNQHQKNNLLQKIQYHYDHYADQSGVKNKIFALWGLSFKPNTDDMREASSRVLMEKLWALSAKIQAFDPAALQEAKRLYPDQPALTLCQSPEEALKGADALIIMTEWRHFASPDFEKIKQLLTAPVIFDGRNLYDPVYLQSLGFDYYAIGRGKNIFHEITRHDKNH